MARSIRLDRYQIAYPDNYYLRGWRIRVAVGEVHGGMDKNVFLYRRMPPNPTTGEILDEFQTVCSWPDMETYPVGSPDATLENPYYRLDYIELDLRAEEDHKWLWYQIANMVCQLVFALNRADSQVTSENQWLGVAETSTSSLSSESTGS